MMENKKKLVTGLMKTRSDAENAVAAILNNGFTRDDISVIMSGSTRAKHFAVETNTKTAEGAGIGSAIGGSVGAIIAAIAAVGTNLILPGLGLVIAGPLAAAFAGAGAGGALGGLVGSLVGSGIPEHEAKAYEEGLKQGGILVGVEARNDQEKQALERILKATGAES